jgi:hypothetical protein
LIIVWVTWEVNSGPISDWKEVGIPNLGMMWVTIIDTTFEALLLEFGKASNHPERLDKNQKVFVFLYLGHISKVYLPIRPWDVSPGLVSREWARP